MVVVLLIYVGMLVFDAFIIAGTAYLVSQENWSAWWFVLTVILCAGSNPKNIIRAGQGLPDQRPNES